MSNRDLSNGQQGFSQGWKTLVIHPGSLGDVILSLPALRAVRRSRPHACLEVMGHAASLAVLTEREEIDRIRSLEMPHLCTFFSRSVPLAENVTNYFLGFDLIISWLNDAEGLFEQNLLHAGVKQAVVTRPISSQGTTHMADRFLSTLSSQIPSLPFFKSPLLPPLGKGGTGGLSPQGGEDRIPRIVLSLEEKKTAVQTLSSFDLVPERDTLVALHPGSGGQRKRWPAEGFSDLAERATAMWGAAVLLLSGPADEEAFAAVRSGAPRARIIPLKDLPLREAASILALCSVFVGSDSGITHLSAAVGTPTVALFGPTDPALWGPRGDHVRIIQCEPHREIGTISVDTVWKAMENVSLKGGKQ